ncbi:MAG: hypothetical protein ACO3EL_06210 [Burkholderiaceae bacterium]
MNTTKIAKTFSSLRISSYDFINNELVKVLVSPTVYVRDNHVVISAEDGKCLADYYGECNKGYPYIHPALEAAAAKFGGYLEWNNPGELSFCV